MLFRSAGMRAADAAEALPARSVGLSPSTVAAERRGAGRLKESRQPRKPFNRAQIERVVAHCVGGFGLIFAIQTYPAMLDQLDSLKPGIGVALSVGIFGALGLTAIAALVSRYVKLASGLVAVLYLIALLAWPVMLDTPDGVLDGKPWLWYLCTVATACAAVSFPLWWATIYTLLAPIVYGVLRVLPAGGSAEPMIGALRSEERRVGKECPV